MRYARDPSRSLRSLVGRSKANAHFVFLTDKSIRSGRNKQDDGLIKEEVGLFPVLAG